jgi:hypothetical protein
MQTRSTCASVSAVGPTSYAYFADGDHPFHAMAIAAFGHDDRSEATHGVSVGAGSLV